MGCRSFRTRLCGNESVHMRVYGHYRDLNGVEKSHFLDFSLKGAIARCDYVKNALWFKTHVYFL